MRRLSWTLAPLLLLLLASWLFSLADVRPIATARAAVEFPTSPRTAEWERMTKRSTLVIPAAALTPSAPDGGGERPATRDPFLAALPARAEDPVIVFEANALRHSRLGEAFVACALAKDPRTFDEIRRETGLDVLKDVDRVAFVGEAVVVSGFFQKLSREDLARATGAAPRRYGAEGTIYAPDGPPARRISAGIWRDQIIVLADDAAVRRSLDQLEGRAPPAPVDLPDEIAYGEAYGVVQGEALRRILRNEPELLADRLSSAARRVELHVDAMQDVAAVARFSGDDTSALEDLAKAMGGVLAASRLGAQAADNQVLADLLDQAAVVPSPTGFSVQVALPADRVESWFAGCGR